MAWPLNHHHSAQTRKCVNLVSAPCSSCLGLGLFSLDSFAYFENVFCILQCYCWRLQWAAEATPKFVGSNSLRGLRRYILLNAFSWFFSNADTRKNHPRYGSDSFWWPINIRPETTMQNRLESPPNLANLEIHFDSNFGLYAKSASWSSQNLFWSRAFVSWRVISVTEEVRSNSKY